MVSYHVEHILKKEGLIFKAYSTRHCELKIYTFWYSDWMSNKIGAFEVCEA